VAGAGVLHRRMVERLDRLVLRMVHVMRVMHMSHTGCMLGMAGRLCRCFESAHELALRHDARQRQEGYQDHSCHESSEPAPA